MQVYLVRHGEAQPGLDDRTRPLTERGRRDVQRVARHTAVLGIRVVEIHHSGLLRARETAEIFARHLSPDRGLREVAGLAAGDDPEAAQAEIDVATDPVMLVGHLPHLGRLASALVVGGAARDVVRFRPGAVACLVKASGGWAVEWVLTPELVGADDTA